MENTIEIKKLHAELIELLDGFVAINTEYQGYPPARIVKKTMARNKEIIAALAALGADEFGNLIDNNK